MAQLGSLVCSWLRLLKIRTRSHSLLKRSASVPWNIVKVWKTRPLGIIIRFVTLSGSSRIIVLATIRLSERLSWLLLIIILCTGMSAIVVRIPLLVIVIRILI